MKLAGVPQTPEPISAISGPNFAILRGLVEEVLLLNTFFRLSIYALVAKIQPDKVVPWGRDGDFFASFLHLVFPASRVQHVSDLHLKFALRPHHVWQTSTLRPLRLGKEKKKDRRYEKKKQQGQNIMSASATQSGHKNVVENVYVTHKFVGPSSAE